MSEKIKKRPIPKEVLAIQKWIETEIVGRGICPPLAKLLQQYRNENGIVQWDTLTSQVEIESFFDLKPLAKKSIEAVAESYLQFIVRASEGRAGMTQVIILPDFPQNKDYDKFMVEVKVVVRAKLFTPEGWVLVRSLFEQKGIKGGLSDIHTGELSEVMKLQEEVIQTIEGLFNPVYFYGKPLSERDVSDFPGARGDQNRQKVLSRAPYYLFQAVNGINTDELVGDLNRKRLYERNTELASETEMPKFEAKLKRLRY